MVPVVNVNDFKGSAYIERDLALITVTVTPETRNRVVETVELFRGKVVDVSRESVVVELAGGKAMGLHFGGIEGERNMAVQAPRVRQILDERLN